MAFFFISSVRITLVHGLIAMKNINVFFIEFRLAVQVMMPFKYFFSIFSTGCHFVHLRGTINTILEDGLTCI